MVGSRVVTGRGGGAMPAGDSIAGLATGAAASTAACQRSAAVLGAAATLTAAASLATTGALPAVAVPAEMPHPGHRPAALVQHRSHACMPQDGHLRIPIPRRCAMWPMRLPHRSQNDIAGPAIGAAVSGPVTVVASDPPASPAGARAGDVVAMDFCVPSNGSPDTMPRARGRVLRTHRPSASSGRQRYTLHTGAADPTSRSVDTGSVPSE